MSPTVAHPRRERPMTMATPQAPSRISDSACIDCLEHSPAAGRRRLAVPRHLAFWLLAFVFAATMLGTTLPTPLYVIYQARWHFSAAIVTVIFAVYAAGVLAALLLAGPVLRPGRAQAGADHRPRCQRAEHCGVHPRPERGRAPGRPDLVRAVRWPHDRYRDRRAHRAGPGLGRPPGVAGGHGREHGRPR